MQAALKQIKGSNGRPLWPGPIDGRNSTRDIDSLSAAIAGFESKANLRITGTLANSGNAFNALGRALPTNYKDMHAIPGTNIVAGHVARKRPKPDGGVGALPLPEALAADLGRMVSRLEAGLHRLPAASSFMVPVPQQSRQPRRRGISINVFGSEAEYEDAIEKTVNRRKPACRGDRHIGCIGERPQRPTGSGGPSI